MPIECEQQLHDQVFQLLLVHNETETQDTDFFDYLTIHSPKIITLLHPYIHYLLDTL